MIHWLKAAIRRWTLDGDILHPHLPKADAVLGDFQVGELVPLKGIMFRVGRIAGGEYPVLLLSPIGKTKGAKLKAMREYRDVGRAHLGRQMFTRQQLEKEYRRAGSTED
jgi:hypothetical protein